MMNRINLEKYKLIDINTNQTQPFPPNRGFAKIEYGVNLNHFFQNADKLSQQLIYHWNNGKFEICSQLRPIHEGKEINNESINIYLDCGWIPSPYTIYKDVFKLPPGNILEIDLNNNTHETIKSMPNLYKLWLKKI